MKLRIFTVILLTILTSSGVAEDLPKNAKSDVQAIAVALKMYRSMNGHYPTTEQGLAALVSRSKAQPLARNWRQLFNKVPIDPWGRPYHYIAYPPTGKATGPQSYEVRSLGANPDDDSDDIIER